MSRLTAAAAVLALALLAPAAALAGGAPPPAAPVVVSSLPSSNLDTEGWVEFDFTADDPGDTFVCSLDTDPPAACDEGYAIYDTLGEGDHTFTVYAVDTDDNPGDPAVVEFTEDYTLPAAPQIDGPPAHSNDSDALLTFTGEAGGSFVCSVDGAPFYSCTSPISLTGLLDGSHELQVQQIDDALNEGDIAIYDWDVDTAAPDAPALRANVPALTFATTATFHFTGEPEGHFECSLGGEPFTHCTSPVTYAHLGAGYQELQVQQVDAAGNVSNQAIFDWQIDPLLAPAPPAPTPASPAAKPAASAPAASDPPQQIVDAAPRVTSPAACVSRRTLTVHWQLPKGTRSAAPQVLINGRVVQTLRPGAVSAKISLAGRGKTVVHVVIRARRADGVALQSDRRYGTCVARNDRAPLHTLMLRVSR